jgi:cytochrome c peroxidase
VSQKIFLLKISSIMKIISTTRTGFLVFLVALAFMSCNQNAAVKSQESTAKENTTNKESLLTKAQSAFSTLPEPASFDRPIAKLGKKLYYETALSASGEMSCNSCHMLDKFGVDNEPTSLGHDKKTRGERNSPSVYNAYFHLAQFWDGRAENLTEQAKGPVLNPGEMGMTGEGAVDELLKASKEYQRLFAEAFPDQEDPANFNNMAAAIAEFEKTLSTPAPFDAYLSGEENALNAQQKKGLETFMQVGCTTCHTGPGLGGQMFQKFGLLKGPYWEYTGSENIDSGRVKVTNSGMDKFSFKVPALRNVAKTAPYFHDGSVASLAEAIKIMGTTQLGKDLSEEQVNDIAAFLESLTGEIPAYALQNQQMAGI